MIMNAEIRKRKMLRRLLLCYFNHYDQPEPNAHGEVIKQDQMEKKDYKDLDFQLEAFGIMVTFLKT